MPSYFIDDSDCLEHYGVMGMKWGVRKDRGKSSGRRRNDPPESYSTTTKNGEQLTMVRNRGSFLARGLGKVNKKIAKEQAKTYNYDAYANGKRVGELQMYKKTPKEMNITWGATKQKYRGKGYMQAMYSIGENVAKKYGATKMTAELVGHSPDIHTVARKNGFKAVGEIKTEDVMATWGGLTLVEKDLK